MLPLMMSQPGEAVVIKRIGGKPEIRQHLEDLGFVAGVSVTLVTESSGNVIVNVKGSRIGISREMAAKIMV